MSKKEGRGAYLFIMCAGMYFAFFAFLGFFDDNSTKNDIYLAFGTFVFGIILFIYGIKNL